MNAYEIRTEENGKKVVILASGTKENYERYKDIVGCYAKIIVEKYKNLMELKHPISSFKNLFNSRQIKDAEHFLSVAHGGLHASLFERELIEDTDEAWKRTEVSVCPEVMQALKDFECHDALTDIALIKAASTLSKKPPFYKRIKNKFT